MLYGILFVLILELNQPANPACASQHIEMLPEQCHATFNRRKEWFES